MLFSVKLPPLGDHAETPVIVEWNAEPGAEVKEGEPLLSVALDKVDIDVPSPVTGTVVAIHAETGTQVEVGQVICAVQT